MVLKLRWIHLVATVLTACGIETSFQRALRKRPWWLQQCLPLAVLKLDEVGDSTGMLQRCNSAYRLRYWNPQELLFGSPLIWFRCNSAYRLRYWNWHEQFDFVHDLIVATVLTACGIETLADNCIMVTGTDYLLQQCLPLAVLKL